LRAWEGGIVEYRGDNWDFNGRFSSAIQLLCLGLTSSHILKGTMPPWAFRWLEISWQLHAWALVH